MASYPHYRAQFGDTTYTKVFVGGLAWETPTEEMRQYFQQFGDILEAVIITDKNTAKSKGYGFVTFRDPESARLACGDPNPVIDGRRANCNIASFGRPRPSTPRGRNQQGGVSFSRVARPVIPPPPPPPPHPVIYPPYGYPTYSPDYGYQQAVYNPQVQQPEYYHQMYGGSSSMASHPYYYGYSFQSPALRGAYNAVPYQPQRLQPPTATATATAPSSYLYYPSPSQMEHGGPYPPPTTTTTIPFQHITRYPFSPSTTIDSSQPQEQHSSTEPESGIIVTSERPDHKEESES